MQCAREAGAAILMESVRIPCPPQAVKPKTPPKGSVFVRIQCARLDVLQAVIDGAEGVADDRAEDHEGRDDDNGDQNKN